MEEFPDEIMVMIFSWLSCTQLCLVSLVNKRWNENSQDESLWTNLCNQKSYSFHKIPGTPSKIYFSQQIKMERNWKKGFCAINEISKASSLESVMCLQFSEERNLLAVGKINAAVEVYDLTSKKLKCTLPHQDSVAVLYFNDNVLITGSNDGSIRIWDFVDPDENENNFLSYRKSFTGKMKNSVRFLYLNNSHAVSAGKSRDISIWDINSGSLSNQIDMAGSTVSFYADSTQIIGGTTTSKLKSFDFESGTATFTGDTDGWATSIKWLPDLQILALGTLGKSLHLYDFRLPKSNFFTFKSQSPINNINIVPGCPDWVISTGGQFTDVEVWNLKMLSNEKNLVGPRKSGGMTVSSTCGKKVVVGSGLGVVRVWDVENGICEATLKHSKAVLCLQMNERRVVSGSWDARIMDWDFGSEGELQDVSGVGEDVELKPEGVWKPKFAT